MKTNIIKFITKNLVHSATHIGFKLKYIEETEHTIPLGLQIDNHINWKSHIEEMIPKLSAARYALVRWSTSIALTLS
jgi:hypothetical protein